MNSMPAIERVISNDGCSYSFELLVPDNLLFFPGHFPEQSILPGVIIVDWSMQLAKEYMVVNPLFKGMEAIKFKRVIMPGDRVCFHLDYDELRQRLLFRIESQRGEHASGRVLIDVESLRERDRECLNLA